MGDCLCPYEVCSIHGDHTTAARRAAAIKRPLDDLRDESNMETASFLKTAREKMCSAQMVCDRSEVVLIQQALDLVDQVGARTGYWNRWDFPTTPRPAPKTWQ